MNELETLKLKIIKLREICDCRIQQAKKFRHKQVSKKMKAGVIFADGLLDAYMEMFNLLTNNLFLNNIYFNLPKNR